MYVRADSALGDLPRTERLAAWIGILDEQAVDGLKDVAGDEQRGERVMCDGRWRSREIAGRRE